MPAHTPALPFSTPARCKSSTAITGSEIQSGSWKYAVRSHAAPRWVAGGRSGMCLLQVMPLARVNLTDGGLDVDQQSRREHQGRVAFFSGECSRRRNTRTARTPASGPWPVRRSAPGAPSATPRYGSRPRDRVRRCAEYCAGANRRRGVAVDGQVAESALGGQPERWGSTPRRVAHSPRTAPCAESSRRAHQAPSGHALPGPHRAPYRGVRRGHERARMRGAGFEQRSLVGEMAVHRQPLHCRLLLDRADSSADRADGAVQFHGDLPFVAASPPGFRPCALAHTNAVAFDEQQ